MNEIIKEFSSPFIYLPILHITGKYVITVAACYFKSDQRNTSITENIHKNLGSNGLGAESIDSKKESTSVFKANMKLRKNNFPSFLLGILCQKIKLKNFWAKKSPQFYVWFVYHSHSFTVGILFIRFFIIKMKFNKAGSLGGGNSQVEPHNVLYIMSLNLIFQTRQNMVFHYDI